MFIAATHFDPSLILVGRAGGTPVEALVGLHSIGRLLDWLAIIRLECKWLAVTS